MKEDLTLYLKRDTRPFCTKNEADSDYPTDSVVVIRPDFLEELYSMAFSGSIELSQMIHPGVQMSKEFFLKPKDISDKISVDVKDNEVYFIGIKIASYAYIEEKPSWGDGFIRWHDIILEFGLKSPGSGGKVLEYSIDEFI